MSFSSVAAGVLFFLLGLLSFSLFTSSVPAAGAAGSEDVDSSEGAIAETPQWTAFADALAKAEKADEAYQATQARLGEELGRVEIALSQPELKKYVYEFQRTEEVTTASATLAAAVKELATTLLTNTNKKGVREIQPKVLDHARPGEKGIVLNGRGPGACSSSSWAGHAVAAPRFTEEFDAFVEPSLLNGKRLRDRARRLGLGEASTS